MATYMNQTNSGRIIVQQTNPTAIIVQPDNERKIILKGSGGLKGETGEQGPAGEAATIAVGTTSTLAPGASATVINSGTSSAAVLDFGIPKGEKGDTGAAGPANTLSIGTVQKGDTAEATITGDAPNQTLNLTLPKGDKGDTGAQGPAGAGVVAGGSTGQVLTKKSGANYDTEWATPTTYSDFTGATSSVAGAHGLVPAPTTSDPDKFLKGDGTWGTPPGTTYIEGTGIDITGNTIAVDTDEVPLKSSATIKKNYTIDISAQNTSNFYPVIFPRTNSMIDCEIHSEGGGAAEPYNQNIIHFQMISQGWSDNKVNKKLIILQEGRYTDNEITIGCIGWGQHDGYNCIWLRGGLRYFFICNYVAELHTSDYTINDEKFTVGTNYYGGSNANVSIIRTPTEYSKDVVLQEDLKIRQLYNYYTSRPTSANTTATGNGGLYTFQATSSMTTGKPKNDSHILQLEWDNNSGFDSQIALSSWDSARWLGYRTQSNGTWGDWTYLLNDEAGSVKTANLDALAVTTAKIADGAITEAKMDATAWAKKVNVASIDLTGETTTLLSLAKALGANNIDYARWECRTNVGSANISDKPTGGVNASFVCEAYCNRWTANNDYRYQLICWVNENTNPFVAYIADYSSSITWERLRPTVNDATLTITQNGSTLGTFSANASSNTTINIPGGGSSYTAGVGIEIANDTIEVDGTVALIDDPTSAETPTPWVGTTEIENGAVTPEKTSFTAYSTTEQVVGTWIDGKPLYRRVFAGTATTMPFSVATLTNCNVKNIYGRITYNGSNYHQIGGYANANYYSLAQQNYSNYNIDLYGSSNYVGQQYELVAEYTKTTD